jgi:hypothetical protein
VSLVGSIGTMMGVMYTPPENTVLKHAFWIGFNACQAATLSPMFFFAPAILSRAALYTCGVVGSLSYMSVHHCFVSVYELTRSIPVALLLRATRTSTWVAHSLLV